MAVGLVFVSHSAKIAEGLTELARQMAPTVALVAAGGTDDGGIGTSFDKISAAMDQADSGDGVVILCDLGSAILTAEIALDMREDPSRVRLADAPLVEGAVAAAVAAEGGAGLDDVVAAAQTAYAPGGGDQQERALADGAPGEQPEDAGEAAQDGREASRQTGQQGTEAAGGLGQGVTDSATLINREGLHARPAAEFVRLAGSFDAAVTVNGVDARSLLRIMALGLTAGDEVTVSATGPQAEEAVQALAGLVRSGFGESGVDE